MPQNSGVEQPQKKPAATFDWAHLGEIITQLWDEQNPDNPVGSPLPHTPINNGDTGPFGTNEADRDSDPNNVIHSWGPEDWVNWLLHRIRDIGTTAGRTAGGDADRSAGDGLTPSLPGGPPGAKDPVIPPGNGNPESGATNNTGVPGWTTPLTPNGVQSHPLGNPSWIRQPENLELAHVLGTFAAQLLAGGLPDGTGPNGSVPWPTPAKGATGHELKDYERDEKRAATDQYGDLSLRGLYQIDRDGENKLQAQLRDDAENGWTYAPGNPEGILPGTMPGTPSLPNAPHNQLDGVYGVTPEQRNDKLRSATGGRLME